MENGGGWREEEEEGWDGDKGKRVCGKCGTATLVLPYVRTYVHTHTPSSRNLSDPLRMGREIPENK